jgi:integrase
VRTVPLAKVVLDGLARHYELVGLTSAETSRFIFTNASGEPIQRSRFGEVWRSAVKRSGLPAGTGFHALRHYYASLLISQDESVKVVQSRLGHASAAETLDTYTHLWPDSEDRTRQAVEAVLGNRHDPPNVRAAEE